MVSKISSGQFTLRFLVLCLLGLVSLLSSECYSDNGEKAQHGSSKQSKKDELGELDPGIATNLLNSPQSTSAQERSEQVAHLENEQQVKVDYYQTLYSSILRKLPRDLRLPKTGYTVVQKRRFDAWVKKELIGKNVFMFHMGKCKVDFDQGAQAFVIHVSHDRDSTSQFVQKNSSIAGKPLRVRGYTHYQRQGIGPHAFKYVTQDEEMATLAEEKQSLPLGVISRIESVTLKYQNRPTNRQMKEDVDWPDFHLSIHLSILNAEPYGLNSIQELGRAQYSNPIIFGTNNSPAVGLVDLGSRNQILVADLQGNFQVWDTLKHRLVKKYAGGVTESAKSKDDSWDPSGPYRQPFKFDSFSSLELAYPQRKFLVEGMTRWSAQPIKMSIAIPGLARKRVSDRPEVWELLKDQYPDRNQAQLRLSPDASSFVVDDRQEVWIGSLNPSPELLSKLDHNINEDLGNHQPRIQPRFSSESRYVNLVVADKQVIFDLKKGNNVLELGRYDRLEFSEGELIVYSKGSFRIVRLRDGSQRLKIHGQWPGKTTLQTPQMCCSKDLIAVADSLGIRILNRQNGSVVRWLPVPRNGEVTAVHFLNGSRHLIASVNEPQANQGEIFISPNQVRKRHSYLCLWEVNQSGFVATNVSSGK